MTLEATATATAQADAPPNAWLRDPGAPLATRVLEFNQYPARYAHPSWWPRGWETALGAVTGEGGRGEARLGVELLHYWGFDARPCLDFENGAWKLALLDPDPLRRLVQLAGLVGHVEEIGRMLERKRVAELRRQLGAEAYGFAVLRAPLMAGSLGSLSLEAPISSPDWPSRVMGAGLALFTAALGDIPPQLSGRTRLKFPRELADYLDPEAAQGSPQGSMRLLKKLLAQEVDPAWENSLS